MQLNVICLKWVHIKCNKFDKKDYITFQTNESLQFYCIECLADTLPFLNLDNNQFDLTTKGIDYPDEVNIDNIFLSTTQLNMMQKINKAIDNSFNFNDDKVDLDTENEINPIDCKY